MHSVTIEGKEVQISPLKMKHLREISKILESGASPKAPTFADLDRWLPFLYDSLGAANQELGVEGVKTLVDNLTMDEFALTWTKILEVSGIKLVTKGEEKPARTLTTQESTEGSSISPAGTIVQ